MFFVFHADKFAAAISANHSLQELTLEDYPKFSDTVKMADLAKSLSTHTSMTTYTISGLDMSCHLPPDFYKKALSQGLAGNTILMQLSIKHITAKHMPSLLLSWT
jgi:hypothetical protein